MGFDPLLAPAIIFHSGHELIWKLVDPEGYEKFQTGMHQQAQQIRGAYTQGWRVASEIAQGDTSSGTAPHPPNRPTNIDEAQCKNRISQYQRLVDEVGKARDQANEFKGYRMWERCKRYRIIHDKKLQELQELWKKIERCPGRPPKSWSAPIDCGDGVPTQKQEIYMSEVSTV